MEIGNEISQKIRSAIKAKLIEQGAYVDDELPDYIMVMVANKKSQKQMTEDLSLFLGSNTEKFTTWLHGLLKKLQSINTDESSTKSKPKEKSKGEKRKHRTHSEKDDKKKTDSDRQRKSSTGDKEKTEKKKTEDKVDPGTAKVKPVAKPEESASDELKIIENTDEFNDENTAADVKALTQSTGKPPPVKVSKVDKSTDVKKSSTKSTAASSKSSSTSASNISRQDSSGSSRKKPTSFVASVKRRYEEIDESEEEYDPNNPAVGSVASVVRGPTRKSSIPKSLQANKSLLMKAVTEAEKSVTTTKKPEVSPESLKSSMRSDREPVSLKHRLKTAAGLGLISRSKRAEMIKAQSSTTTSGSQDSLKKPHKSSDGFENIKYTIKNESGTRKISPKSATAAPVRVATKALREIGSVTQIKQEPDADNEEEEDQEDEEYGPVLPDTRLVQRTKPDTDSNPESSPTASPALQIQDDDDSPDPEIQQLLDEAHMSLDLNDDIINDDEAFKYQPRITKCVSPEPRFIVTLDGVDPDTYTRMLDVKQNPVQTVKPVMKPRPSVEEQPKSVVTPTVDNTEQSFAKIQPPKIKPFNISLKDTDDEEEGEEMETEETESGRPATINERCRFWPSCANGNACQFIHPSIPCKTFPYCKFGDKCIYIHPNCKFDANCTKMDCPYTHSCKRKALTAPTVIHKILQVPIPQYMPQIDPFKSSKPYIPGGNIQATQCRFFPNCRNMNCPFVHPKPCRYGIGCMNKNTCAFHHPPLPGADKLKWSSSKATKSTTETTPKTTSSDVPK